MRRPSERSAAATVTPERPDRPLRRPPTNERGSVRTSSLIDSLHPLELKVLTSLGSRPSAVSIEELTEASALEPSQLSMAVEWLLAKGLIQIESESVTQSVSLTKVGETYLESKTPIERVLDAARDAGHTGNRLTLQDIQNKEGFEPGDISGAVGMLKKEGAILIVQGGCLEATGRPSPTADTIRTLLQELRAAPRNFYTFPEPTRKVIQQHAVRRGNTREPFRIDERVIRTVALTADGREAVQQLAQQGIEEEVSQLTPELLKEGAWRTKRFRQ